MSIESVLTDFLEVPGALGAAFLDASGQTVAKAGSPGAVDLLGAHQSVWLAELTRVAQRAGLGELSDLCLDFDSYRILSAEVKAGYFLLVVFDESGLVSVGRALLSEARRSLANEIN